ncbi:MULTISPECIES: ankyrin repeat domain-containing protein [unclassified Corynebacterium]|jgi:ankyrin protein|uniref:ankyrin repeat domain-containing protein n=1 Tax=Corynebacterium TaxID=1716 RepID=UPI00254C9D6E|nr:MULTISPECIES: ankyrin repeat domain-containing protein [unclassified Corynebacterium]MDK8452375.1 ankyrin repeat domain-containing protein [Corynebacterium sp. MSK084]MDK8466880.1 ankyrin repeat domain-containing protein [Corynebacterium sp. MSK130]MDK8476137.1 ankyrin repeat domain-containing protein [Corynebacterium sp. MSK310]MDK8490890.1 ankyrin repeat domain-containing protein [Corynebacterium sp. MSK175]MDK8514435.1 ankyrin repeat domain-containing protein [Corynebacterium sp. MSK123]
MSEEQVQEFAGRLFDMAREGNPDLLNYIDQGVNINLVNQDGQSFLMLAAYHGHADLVTALAGAGADVNLLNDRGQSPLAGAIFKKEDAVIDALLNAGASATAGQPTAIDSARMFGREDLLGRLEGESAQ